MNSHVMKITIQHSLYIQKPREAVWDYTQDYTHRSEWDKSVLEATVLQTTPHRIVKLKIRGGSTTTFVYKLDERPNKTSLAMKEIESKWIKGGGGSWNYEDQNGGTLWSQTNTLVFKSGILSWFFQPSLKYIFRHQMRMAMTRVKIIMEKK
jgi:hypothetical protein